MAGVAFNHVPYNAPGQVAIDAAAGRIDVSVNWKNGANGCAWR